MKKIEVEVLSVDKKPYEIEYLKDSIQHRYRKISVQKVQVYKEGEYYFVKTVVCQRQFVMFHSKNLDVVTEIVFQLARYEEEKLWKKVSESYQIRKTKKPKEYLAQKYSKSQQEIDDFFNNWSWENYCDYIAYVKEKRNSRRRKKV